MPFAPTSAAAIDEVIARVTADPWKDLPRLVVMAATSEGVVYSGAGGVDWVPDTPEELKDAEKSSENTVFDLYSCTKLIAVLTGLQLIERGVIGLHDEVSKWVPELKDLKRFDGWSDDGEPKLVPVDKQPTVEDLITHQGGWVYQFDGEDATKLAAKLELSMPYTKDSTNETLTNMPVMYAPGERYHYGTSNDYLGLVVEAASGLSLGDFMKKNIFEPLGITDLDYAVHPKRVNMAHASAEAPSTPLTYEKGSDLRADRGGAGLNGSPKSYLTILRAILGRGQLNGVRILKEETVDSMFKPHLKTQQAIDDLKLFSANGSNPFTRAAGVAFPGVDHGYGGLLCGEGNPSGRAKASLTWSGMANTFWIIDPTNDVAFVLFYNVIPYGFERVFSSWHEIEPKIYEGLKA